MSTDLVAVPSAGLTTRADLGGSSMERSAEQSTSAMEAAASAMVQSRFMMAVRFPRSWMNVRRALLDACERPGFAGSDAADKLAIKQGTPKAKGGAWFVKPVGKGIEGFTIRFAEECARAMGNLDIQSMVVWEDAERRVVQVVVLDLQSNLSYPTACSIEKTVERKGHIAGAIRYRKNSYGQDLSILPATDDDVTQRQGVLVSKAIRNGILRLVPGDILAECERRILAIRFGDAAADPQKVAREITDGFAKLAVKPSDLALLLGHELEASSPAELAGLRELWKEISQGRTTWKTTLDETLRERNGAEPAADTLLDKLKQPAGKAPAAGCSHPGIKPSAVDALPFGQALVCADCGEEFPSPAPAPVEREPGSDDGDEEAAPVAAEDARAAVARLAARAGQKR